MAIGSFILRAARIGVTTPHFMEKLNGAWCHVAVTGQRGLPSFLERCYSEPRGPGQAHVFSMSEKLKEEMAHLTIMGLLGRVSLRSAPATKLYCVDASPWGTAAVETEIPVSVSWELRGHIEKKGRNVSLLSSAARYLLEVGLGSWLDEEHDGFEEMEEKQKAQPWAKCCDWFRFWGNFQVSYT